MTARSAADSREVYLRRPDLGRRLATESAAALDRAGAAHPAAPDLCIVIGDGLSAVAVQSHAVPLLLQLRLQGLGGPGSARVQEAPVVIATQARVALADDIAERLRARLVVMLIGERPGLSAPDSLGVYTTWAPHVGRTDAERNCISNVRAEGLSYPAAAFRLAWLVEQAFERQLTGVELKDESDRVALNAAPERPLLVRKD
jgi:ethanolamine ammonia-lyase small subunit